LRDPEVHSLFEQIAAGTELAFSEKKRTRLFDEPLRMGLARAHETTAAGYPSSGVGVCFEPGETVRKPNPKISPSTPFAVDDGVLIEQQLLPIVGERML
jgi:hypothetical protein